MLSLMRSAGSRSKEPFKPNGYIIAAKKESRARMLAKADQPIKSIYGR